MKKNNLVSLTLTGILMLMFQLGFAQINTPRPSPAGIASTTVGLTDVEIAYYRPQMKGRKIFGEGDDFLVPFGNRWRAGANSGTTVTFSTDVIVAGKNIEAGEYLIILTPGAKEWEVILYADKSLGSRVNKTEDDKIALQTKVSAAKLSETVETLTYQISDLSADSQSANLQMTWENTVINIPIKVSFDEVVMKAIAENTVVKPGNLMTAARYYYDTDKNLNQALEWVNSYLAIEKNSKQFWNIYVKAQILAKMGNKKDALKTANASMELAKNNEGGDFGYVKRNQDLIASLK